MNKALRRPNPSTRLALSLGGLFMLLLLWGFGTRMLEQNIALANLLSPRETFQSLYELLVENQLTLHTLTSMKRVLVGLGLALLIGVTIGLAIGSSRELENITGIAFQSLRLISPFSCPSIAFMIFGLSNAPFAFLLMLTAFCPITLNTPYLLLQLHPHY